MCSWSERLFHQRVRALEDLNVVHHPLRSLFLRAFEGAFEGIHSIRFRY